MADRTVRVVLTAATQQFDAAMQKASASAKSLDQELRSAAKSGVLDDMAGRATMIGGAWTAVNAAVAKTGIEYNTLQQTSRAALTTMLGSATEVNAQMDKLDEFARTSPFSKATFITAQQQMLAFGIEAEKVVPYLSAINDATAAAGGNNQTLSELAFIMAQIGAAGKITAQDLMQFGQRGVNAAELIGSQMGKTGAQIRDDITNGALDANAALDALAAGMSERFEGASANVKDTMAGAFDRVKAAFRDLSAEIMSGAVSPDGGGWLVDWTNGLADLLRLVQKIPDPIKQTAGALSAIGGVSLLATGGVLKLVTASVKMRDTFDALALTSPRLASGLTAVGKAAGVAMAAFAAVTVVAQISEAMESAATGADNATAALSRLKAGTGDLDSVFRRINGEALISQIGQQVDDLESAFERFGSRGLRHMDQLDAVMSGIFGTTPQLERLREQFALLDSELSSMSASDAAESFAYLKEQADAAKLPVGDLLELFPQYASQIQLLAAEQGLAELSGEDLVDAMLGLNPALTDAAAAAGNAAGATGDFAAETEAAAAAAEQLSSDVRETLSSLDDYYSAALSASGATIAVEEAFDKAADAAKKNGQSLDLTTEKGRANQSALNGVAAAASRQAEAMLAAGESTDSIAAATQRARDQFVDVAQKMGLSQVEAQKLADKYGLIPDQVVTRLSQPGMELSQEEAQAYREMLANLPDEVRTHIKTIPDLSGYYDVNNALNNIEGRTVTAYVAMKKYGQGGVATGGRIGDVAAAHGLAGGGYSGYVRGPGTTTSDEAVTVNLSRDEFVIRAWAASRIGAANLYHMNRTGQLPTRPQNIINRTSTATASTVNNNHEAPQITLAPGSIHIHGLNAVHAVEEFQRELAGRFEQTGGRHG